MIEVNLIYALCEQVKNALKDLRLEKPERVEIRKPGSLFLESQKAEIKEKNYIQIKVFNGWLPNKEATVDDFPFVTVRPVAGQISSGLTNLDVELVVGSFSRDELAYNDVMNVMHRVITSLITLNDNVLNHKYERTGDVLWSLPFDQTEPFFQCVITTHWIIYSSEFFKTLE